MQSKHSILIIDDEGKIRKSLSGLLQDNGYDVTTFSNGIKGLKALDVKCFNIVILDIVMPDIDGIELLKRIKHACKNTEIIMITGYADKEKAVSTFRHGAYDFIEKPFESKDILNTIKHCLNQQDLKNEIEKNALKIAKEEEKYRDLYDNAPNMYHTLDKKGIITECNQAWPKKTGYTKEEIIHKPIYSFYTKKSKEDFDREFSEILTKKKVTGIERELITKNHGIINVMMDSTPMLDEKGNTIGIRTIMIDITKRKLAEKELAAEKEYLAVTLRSIGDGVITTNIKGQILLINKIAEELTGWKEKEAVGKPIANVFSIIDEKTKEHCKNPIETTIKTGGSIRTNYNILISRNGAEHIICDNSAPIRDKDSKIVGAVLVFRNITDQRKMEQELLKVSKLDSLGILAGGIAHDFNNVLTALLGNISLAKICTNPQDEAFELLTEAERASIRAKELTQQLLTFSKGGAPIKKITSISELLIDTTDFALSGSNVRCNFSIPKDLWTVDVDEGQISQVINNLIINADQSMPEGGTIKIIAKNITITQKQKDIPLLRGSYVKITIKDEGDGIPKENIVKIFDPYFTTKEDGNGLGLATCYSIINNHDGYINVESEIGIGSTFFVYLPSHSKRELKIKNKEIYEITFKGKGKILVMDDEEIILKIAGKLLNRLGYTVEFAKDGNKMINMYKKSKSSGMPFDAVIMDLTIPGGMGGKESIGKLLKIDPAAKAIVSSGYFNDTIMADYRKYGFSGVITKPYKIEELSSTLYKIMIKNNYKQ